MIVGVEHAPGVRQAVQAAVAEHGRTREALVAVLSAVNRTLGYLPAAALAEVSRDLGVPASEILSVASFYSRLSTQPRGRHVVQYCQDAPCHVVGGHSVWQALQAALGVAAGETSADGQWTLLATSCIGLCALGPLVVVDDDVHTNVTAERVPAILARYA